MILFKFILVLYECTCILAKWSWCKISHCVNPCLSLNIKYCTIGLVISWTDIAIQTHLYFVEKVDHECNTWLLLGLGREWRQRIAYCHFVAPEHERAFNNVIRIPPPGGSFDHLDLLLIVIDQQDVDDVIMWRMVWRTGVFKTIIYVCRSHWTHCGLKLLYHAGTITWPMANTLRTYISCPCVYHMR